MTDTVMGLDVHGRPPPDPDDAAMPTVAELAGVAADEHGLWVVSRDPAGDPAPWLTPPISYRLGRDGTIRDTLAGELPGCHPWVHGTAEREDFSITPAGYQRAGALVLSNIVVVGGFGRLGDLAGTPLTFVPEVFGSAFCIDPDVLAEIGPPEHDPNSSEPRRTIRKIDPILHAIRHASFLLGIRNPDGSWAVEPDEYAAQALDDWWRYWLAPVRKALAGWWGGGTGAGISFEGPAPGQRRATTHPAIGMVCPTCGKPAGA